MDYAPLANSLEKSLRTRVVAFRHYIDALLAKNPDASLAFRGALKMIRVYAKYLPLQLAKELERSPRPTAEERFRIVSGLLEDLLTKIEETDIRFARGGQDEVPRALGSLLISEFERLQLPRDGQGEPATMADVQPVLSIGVPGTFETRIEDLESFLFHGVMDLVPYEQDAEFEREQYALISLPHFEGTQVMWNPIVVGHEAAHVYLFRRNYRNARGNRLGWYSRDVHQSLTGKATDDEWRYAWIEEILSDLNAIRLYGPAAFAAMCEILSGFEESGDYLEHPPTFLRVKVMMAALEHIGDSPAARGWWSPIIDPWEILSVFTADFEPGVAGDAGSDLTAEQSAFAKIVALGASALVDEVLSWPGSGEAYAFAGRGDVVRAVGARFQRHVTSGASVSVDRQGVQQDVDLLEADVVNAAWFAAVGVTDEAEYGRVVRLASKSIDTLELINLARGAAEDSGLADKDRLVIATRRPDAAGPDARDEGVRSDTKQDETHRGHLSGSILSRSEVEHRVFVDGDLVVDPLFRDAVGTAGVDLRLGPEFIVFTRTGTSEFDPLSEAADYSSLQKLVSKGWGDKFVLHPNELVLASTLEYIVLPTDLTGDITSRSSYGRLGLLTVTAAQVQPGSTGCITLELLNEGMTPIALTPGLRIAQLRLHRVTSEGKREGSKYDCAVGPEFPKVGDDWDRAVLDALRVKARVLRQQTRHLLRGD